MTHGAKDCVVPFLANQPNPSPTNPPLLLVHAALSSGGYRNRSARETWRDCTVYTDGDGRPEERRRRRRRRSSQRPALARGQAQQSIRGRRRKVGGEEADLSLRRRRKGG